GLDTGVIHKFTPTRPKSNYGKSKLQAEQQIKTLDNEHSRIPLIRPPMIYGKGCKGNYQALAKFSLKSRFFLDIHNRRSMIYIDNLSEFIRMLIDQYAYGLFFPQNKEFVCTSLMVKMIAEKHGHNITLTKLF